MKSAIEDIMSEDSRLMEYMKRYIKDSKALDELIVCDEQLTAIFKNDPKMKELFETFKKWSEGYSADEATAHYKIGFRSGFLLALDVLSED